MEHKKLGTLLICAVVVFSLFLGCSSEPKYALYIVQSQGEIADDLETLVAAYADETGKEVRLFNIRAGEDPMSTLRAEMNKNEKPTLFSVEGQRQLDEWIQGDLVMSLSDWDFTDKIVFGQGGIERGGNIYGIPTGIEGFGYVYDERMLSALGLTESDINFLKSCTYDEFEVFLTAIDSFIAGETISGRWSMMNNAEKTGVLANVKAAFSFPGTEGWSYGNHLISIPLLYEFENQINTLNATTTDFPYAAQYRGAIDLMVNHTAEGFSRDLLQNNYDAQVNIGLGTGEVFFIMQGNWIYSDVAKVDAEKAANLDFLPIKYPETYDGVTVPNAYNDSITVFAPRYWAINNKVSEAQQDEAKAFLEWMYTSDMGKDYIINKFSYIPAVEGFDNSQVTNKLGVSILGYMEEGKTVDAPFMAMPDGWAWHDVADKLQEDYLISGNEESFYSVIDSAIDRWAELKQ